MISSSIDLSEGRKFSSNTYEEKQRTIRLNNEKRVPWKPDSLAEYSKYSWYNAFTIYDDFSFTMSTNSTKTIQNYINAYDSNNTISKFSGGFNISYTDSDNTTHYIQKIYEDVLEYSTEPDIKSICTEKEIKTGIFTGDKKEVIKKLNLFRKYQKRLEQKYTQSMRVCTDTSRCLQCDIKLFPWDTKESISKKCSKIYYTPKHEYKIAWKKDFYKVKNLFIEDDRLPYKWNNVMNYKEYIKNLVSESSSNRRRWFQRNDRLLRFPSKWGDAIERDIRDSDL